MNTSSTTGPHSPPPAGPSPALHLDQTEFNVIFVHSRLDDYGLSPAQFRVYCHLARRAGHGAAWPSVENMARVCRLHPKTVRRALRVLTAHRLLKREPRHGQTALYTLTAPSLWQPPTRIDDPSPSDTPVSEGQGTPPKRGQGHPSQNEPDEGNPSEGNPEKGENTQAGAPARCSLPRNEEEAVAWATLDGIPADFARQEFNRLDAVGWLDGCQRPVRRWRPYLKARWTKAQSERMERQTRAGVTTRKDKPSVWELRTRLEEVGRAIKDHPANQDHDYGPDPSSPAQRKELRTLETERERLRQAIIGFDAPATGNAAPRAPLDAH